MFRHTFSPDYQSATGPWAFLYLVTIVAVNVGFMLVPPIDLGFGLFSPIALLVGATFIVRDFAQRQVGSSYMLLYMGVGLVLSYVMANPFIALASAAAFLISEMVDWAVFTWTKRPFKQRMLISNAVSVPVDSLVFLTIAGIFTPATFGIMIASKAVATLLVWWLYRGDEEDDPYRSPYFDHL